MATWDFTSTRHHVLICNGGSCMRKGGEEVTQAIRQEIQAKGLHNAIHTTRTRCNGRCDDACVVIVYPEGVWYKHVTKQIGKEIVRQHLIGEVPIQSHASYSYSRTKQCFEQNEGCVLGTKK